MTEGTVPLMPAHHRENPQAETCRQRHDVVGSTSTGAEGVSGVGVGSKMAEGQMDYVIHHRHVIHPTPGLVHLGRPI